MPKLKGKGILLSALLKDTTGKLDGLFSTLSLYTNAVHQAGKLEIQTILSFGLIR